MLGLGNPKWHHSSHRPRAEDSRKKTTPNISAMCGFTSTWTPCGLCCCLVLFPEESQGFLLELRPGRAGLVPGVKVLACAPAAHAASWHHCQQPGTATARCCRELCVAVPAQPLLCATREPGRDLLVGWGGPGHGGTLGRDGGYQHQFRNQGALHLGSSGFSRGGTTFSRVHWWSSSSVQP